MNDEPDLEKLEDFLRRGLAVALEHEDPARFCAWVEAELPGAGLLPLDAIEPALRRVVATQLARRLWNAVPLPGNGFRPRPLPEPRGNERCPCGAVANYKRCCGRRTGLPLPTFEVGEMMPLVLELLPPERRRRIMDDASAPLRSRVLLAAIEAADGNCAFAIDSLLPIFAAPIEKPTTDHADALGVLVDACREADRDSEVRPLLEQTAAAESRSELRTRAAIMLAEVAVGEGDIERARRLVDQAAADHRHAPGLAHAELKVLFCEGRFDEAERHAERAIARLVRDPDGETEAEQIEELMARFEAAADELLADDRPDGSAGPEA